MTNVDTRLLDSLTKSVEERRGSLDKGPRPPDDDPMEARVAKLESAVEYIQRDIGELKDDVREIRRDMRTDFRLLFGAIIATALSLAGLMAKGFHWF